MTNSFWREVLDHIPGLVLLFRVDENEDAHLIFANSQIQTVLGYTPEEFVLASESSGSRVQTEVAELVEKIAELSHEDSEGGEPICRFHSKRAAEYSFAFEFRIFSVKSSPLPFIAVSLEPEKRSGQTAPGTHESTQNGGSDFPEFVNTSPLMEALMNKVDTVTDQQIPLLFRGDRGTGKRTLARQVLQAEQLAGNITREWDLTAMSAAGQNEAVEALCTGAEPDNGSVIKSDRMCLLIIEISRLTQANQKKILTWLRERMGSGKPIRILATTRTLLEEQMKRGRFSMELYYMLSFDTILLPPLSQRKEDIRVLTEKWVPRAARALGLGSLEVPAAVMERLLSHEWPGNFHEYFNVMRRSLLLSDGSVFRLAMESVQPVEQKREGAQSESGVNMDEIIVFDEMNRRYLSHVLKKTGGKIYGSDGAAHLLGMKPTTLQSKLKKLGVR